MPMHFEAKTNQELNTHQNCLRTPNVETSENRCFVVDKHKWMSLVAPKIKLSKHGGSKCSSNCQNKYCVRLQKWKCFAALLQESGSKKNVTRKSRFPGSKSNCNKIVALCGENQNAYLIVGRWWPHVSENQNLNVSLSEDAFAQNLIVTRLWPPVAVSPNSPNLSWCVHLPQATHGLSHKIIKTDRTKWVESVDFDSSSSFVHSFIESMFSN